MFQKLESASFQSTYTILASWNYLVKTPKISKIDIQMNFSEYYNMILKKNTIPYRNFYSVRNICWHEKFISKNETNFRHGVVGLVKTAGGGSKRPGRWRGSWGRGVSHSDPTFKVKCKKIKTRWNQRIFVSNESCWSS